MSGIRYISLASFICLMLTLIIIVFEMPFYWKDYRPTLTPPLNNVVWDCSSFNFFNGAGIVFFAFTN
jgi:amino acid transporter